MTTFRKGSIIFILMIVFAAGVYTQRTQILDWYRTFSKPDLPVSLEYQQMLIQDQKEKDAAQDLIPKQEEEIKTDEEEPSFEETVIVEEPTSTQSQEPAEEPVIQPKEETIPEPATVPSSLNLAVPFTSQAPDGNWDEPYQEACEEASLYMTQQYYAGQPEGKIDADRASEELLNIVAFERELFGYYEDTTAEQTGLLAETMFGLTARLIQNPTIDDVKNELVLGHPVIVPAAGRLLGNPYFTAPGPIYHMLVIRGYTENDQFIVNDPGTSHGEAFLYDFDKLFYALHDWNNGEEITQGAKTVLILSP
ncbi:MAG: hypothetical protein UT30_C0003G0017 [Candidatus Uhrbacteria bacterium GW2011_GWF2_39_13]|uniref:Peptidase C39-like domain-containing protein n=1 Tax=Candidatus Uhrbacteria bacterium GW2011_GWF2_39_13 TaxID=1618995 RepID=A0A0G0MNX4_9BACT|nr:MAG: hypothetical protein UT30_C0003G0017 [Candidatus Uhrbacteria bacterium GW2011_GWF2_39_13]HAU66258.1 hypothetical protein [Candidatus Uhrbacteria bacterium]